MKVTIFTKIKRWYNKHLSCWPQLTPIRQLRTCYDYDVKDDITAFELFQIKPIPIVYAHPGETVDQAFSRRDEWYNNLSENCKRHLKKYEDMVTVGYKELEEYKKRN